jgi:hypothetical protein
VIGIGSVSIEQRAIARLVHMWSGTLAAIAGRDVTA